MPTIICDHCQYVGSGEDYTERIADVEEHEKTCSERPETMKLWTSTTGRIDLEMTAEQAASVHRSGRCDDDVLALSKVPAIAEQLAKINETVLKEVLSEYGFEEIEDHKQNLQRLVWLAGCDISDSD